VKPSLFHFIGHPTISFSLNTVPTRIAIAGTTDERPTLNTTITDERPTSNVQRPTSNWRMVSDFDKNELQNKIRYQWVLICSMPQASLRTVFMPLSKLGHNLSSESSLTWTLDVER
jgi:hypothetical protein